MLRPLPLAEYQRFVVSGQQQLFSFGWIGAYASPDAYLAPAVPLGVGRQPRRAPIGRRGLRCCGQARGQGDPAERAELWAQAQQIVLDEAFVVPIAQFRTQVVVAPRVRGFAHAVDGTVDWREVWLADA